MAIEGMLKGYSSRGGSRFGGPSLAGLSSAKPVKGLSLTRSSIDVAFGSAQAGDSSALSQGKANAVDGLALIKAADAGFADIESKLDDMKVLAAQAASVKLVASDPTPATTSQTERAILHTQFSELRDGITAVADRTTYGGQTLLKGDGAGGALSLSVNVGGGSASADQVSLSIRAATVAGLDSGLATADLFSVSSANSALDTVSTALLVAQNGRADLRAAGVRLDAGKAGADSRLREVNSEIENRFSPAVRLDPSLELVGAVAAEAGVNVAGQGNETLRGLIEAMESSFVAPASAYPPPPEAATKDAPAKPAAKSADHRESRGAQVDTEA